jgi:hypothetical protein
MASRAKEAEILLITNACDSTENFSWSYLATLKWKNNALGGLTTSKVF